MTATTTTVRADDIVIGDKVDLGALGTGLVLSAVNLYPFTKTTLVLGLGGGTSAEIVLAPTTTVEVTR